MQTEHKETSTDVEVNKRLDAIESMLFEVIRLMTKDSVEISLGDVGTTLYSYKNMLNRHVVDLKAGRKDCIHFSN